MSISRRSFLKSGVLTAGMLASMGLGACANSSTSTETSDGDSTDTAASGTALNGTIAVIRNMATSDDTVQFFDGATVEGTELGFSVETFSSEGDDSKMVNLLDQLLDKNYDIVVIATANEGYQNKYTQSFVDKGAKVVCFDCAGDQVSGVNYNTQDDEELAKVSLEGMIDKVKEAGGSEPVKFIEINAPSAILPFQRRHDQIEDMVADGQLENVQQISNIMTGDSYSTINTAVSTAIASDVNKEIKGIWAASAGFLDGAIDAIEASGRDDIVMTCVDIDNTEIQRLVEHPNHWCTACTDAYIRGVINVRLGVLEWLGEEVPDEYTFESSLVTNEDVKDGDTVATIFPTTTDEFVTEKLTAVREAAAAGEAYSA